MDKNIECRRRCPALPLPIPFALAQEAFRKIEAMPAFKTCGSSSGAGSGGWVGGAATSPSAAAALLAAKQPLEPALAELRAGLRRQLQALRLQADDLQDCLTVGGGGSSRGWVGRDGTGWDGMGAGVWGADGVGRTT